jgi:hypothetical protein
MKPGERFTFPHYFTNHNGERNVLLPMHMLPKSYPFQTAYWIFDSEEDANHRTARGLRVWIDLCARETPNGGSADVGRSGHKDVIVQIDAKYLPEVTHNILGLVSL